MIESLFNILNHPNNKGKTLKTVLRLIWWKINQKVFKLPAVVEIKKDVVCICYPNSSNGGLVVYTGMHEYNEMKFMDGLLTEKSIFIDVGANIGTYSLIAAAKSSKGKVYAFEPLDTPLHNLKQNILLNQFEDIISVHDFVVSDKEGFEYFSEENESEVSHITTNKNNKVKQIKAITLDKFINDNKIGNIDLVKIDVEGAELKVLQGMKDALRQKKVKTLIIEINENERNFGYTPRDVSKIFTENGYRIYKLDSNNNLKSFDLSMAETNKTENIIARVDK